MGKPNFRQNSAFTLLELMIVFAIIAALSVMGGVAYMNNLAKGYDAKRKTDLYHIKQAIEEYENDHNCYPLYGDEVSCEPGTQLQPYLAKIPCDPKTKTSYGYDNDGDAVCPRWFRVFAVLDNRGDTSLIPGIGPNGRWNYYTGSTQAPRP